MKIDRKTLYATSILPLTWLLFVCIEVGVVVNHNRDQLGLPFRLFEDLVFVMSFFFYTAGGLASFQQSPYFEIFLRFTLQFFFWWVIGYGIVRLKKKFGGPRAPKAQ